MHPVPPLHSITSSPEMHFRLQISNFVQHGVIILLTFMDNYRSSRMIFPSLPSSIGTQLPSSQGPWLKLGSVIMASEKPLNFWTPLEARHSKLPVLCLRVLPQGLYVCI